MVQSWHVAPFTPQVESALPARHVLPTQHPEQVAAQLSGATQLVPFKQPQAPLPMQQGDLLTVSPASSS